MLIAAAAMIEAPRQASATATCVLVTVFVLTAVKVVVGSNIFEN